MGRRRAVAPSARAQEIVDYIAAGNSFADAAKHLKVHSGIVSRIIARWAPHLKPPRRQPSQLWPKADWKNADLITEVSNLWSDGLSIREIGRRTNLSENQVVGKVHRLGLPGRLSPIVRRVS